MAIRFSRIVMDSGFRATVPVELVFALTSSLIKTVQQKMITTLRRTWNDMLAFLAPRLVLRTKRGGGMCMWEPEGNLSSSGCFLELDKTRMRPLDAPS